VPPPWGWDAGGTRTRGWRSGLYPVAPSRLERGLEVPSRRHKRVALVFGILPGTGRHKRVALVLENARSGVSHSSLDGAQQRRRPQVPQARRRGVKKDNNNPRRGEF
jgi:hypothetical protein